MKCRTCYEPLPEGVATDLCSRCAAVDTVRGRAKRVPASAVVVLCCFILTLLVYSGLTIRNLTLSDETLISLLTSNPRATKSGDPFFQGPDEPAHREFVKQTILEKMREMIRRSMTYGWWFMGGLTFTILVLFGRVRGSTVLAQIIACLITVASASSIPDNLKAYDVTSHGLLLTDVVSACAVTIMMTTAFMVLFLKETRSYFQKSVPKMLTGVGRPAPGGTAAYVLKLLAVVVLASIAGVVGVILYVTSRSNGSVADAREFHSAVKRDAKSVRGLTDSVCASLPCGERPSDALPSLVLQAQSAISSAVREIESFPLPSSKTAKDYRATMLAYLKAESRLIEAVQAMPGELEAARTYIDPHLQARTTAYHALEEAAKPFLVEFRLPR